MQSVFNENPGHRTEAEWRQMLLDLMESLAAYTGIGFAPTSWFIDDHPGHASACGCVDLRGCISQSLQLDACGVICISVNHGEAAWVLADVLLYSNGRRVHGPDGTEFVSFHYRADGWSSQGWMNSECGEWKWEYYDTDARWHRGDLYAARYRT